MDVLDIGSTFTDYCIVCDRAIIPVKEKEPVKGKKKVAGGTIRVKNADGTVMVRNANGTKITRPPLKRGPNSATRLAMAAANNTAAAKLQPLTRSKTTGTDVDTTTGDANELATKDTDSPESVALKTPKTPSDNFASTIYCSRSCAQLDNDRSSDFARRYSHDMTSPGLHLVTSGLPLSGKSSSSSPSPICISGSDTSSNADPASAGPGASSVPKSFFQFGKEGPDDAWNAVNRENRDRRSSMHPAVRPVNMTREPSQASYYSIGPSSDSLNSLWIEQDALERSISGSGQIRHTPVAGSHAIPVRPTPRQSTSNASLAASPRPVAIPAEFGSAPEHTFDLWNSYHNSFAKRDATGTSASRCFIENGSTPTTSPPVSTSRRPSYSLSRVSGTIRVNKSHTNVTWDSFGQEELRAKERRSSMKAPLSFGPTEHGSTPKQSIEVGKNGCQIKYYQPGCPVPSSPYLGASPRPANPRRASAKSVRSIRSDSSSSDMEQYAQGRTSRAGLQIPRTENALSSSNGSAARTPTTRMLPFAAVPTRPTSSAMPDLAALRVGSGGCAPTATPTSAPRSTWNWAEFEKKGGKTYEVPPGLKAHAGKSGLFYFQ